jgi:hypothetical protein
MNRSEVPQSGGLYGDLREVAYAVDENGRYVLEPSLGWDAKGIANSQFWKTVEATARTAMARVEKGEAGPLLFYMAIYQMDANLLAKYVGISAWRVRRHLRPGAFAKLKPALRQRYADVFDLPVGMLDHLPSNIQRFAEILQWANKF